MGGEKDDPFWKILEDDANAIGGGKKERLEHGFPTSVTMTQLVCGIEIIAENDPELMGTLSTFILKTSASITENKSLKRTNERIKNLIREMEV